MKRVYLDNGATSFPKAPGVVNAMTEFMNDVGSNINRSTYESAKNASMRVFETRLKVAKFFSFGGPETHVIFTPGATFSLNTMILGYVKPGDHVITSSLEHNAVMRALNHIDGVEFSKIKADEFGNSDMEHAAALFNEKTRLAVVNHASNVSGSIFPLTEFSRLCHKNGVKLVVDASQSSGHLPIDFDGLKLSGLAAPCHKGLLGPQGLGLMLLSEDFAKELRPIVVGGTGSYSDMEVEVESMPDKFESGTMNVPAIFGLSASLDYLNEIGIDKLREHDIMLYDRFVEKLKGADVRIVGGADSSKKVGVISLDFLKVDNGIAGHKLEHDYGIMTRVGLHCAPGAHKTHNSFPKGSVRFSFQIANTTEDIDYAAEAVRKIAAD